jgi:hypothetical protein
MKWKITVLMIAASFFIAITCSSCNRQVPSTQPYKSLVLSTYALEIPESKMVDLEVNQHAYSKMAGEATYTLTNLTDVAYLFEEAYTLEVKQGGQWFAIPFRSDYRAFPAIVHVLPPGESCSRAIVLSEHLPLDSGQYRVCQKISPQSDIKNDIVLAGLFSIT